MNRPTAVLLTVVLATACSAGSPVGYFDSLRVASDSVASHAALDAPNQRLRAAQDAVTRAQDALAHAGEMTVAGRRDDLQAAGAELEKATRDRTAAGKVLDNRISVIVTGLSSPRGMTLVIPLDGVPPYSSPNTDLTDAVIAALDGGTSELARARTAANVAVARARQLEAAAAATGPPDAGRRK